MELFPPEDPLEEPRRLYRQACLLEFLDQKAEAARLLSEVLPQKISALQEHSAVSDAELQAAFASERCRVSDAQILSEILLPKFMAALEDASPPQIPAPSTPTQARGRQTVAHTGPDKLRPSGPAVAPTIVDLLDDMLDQDRNRSRRSR